MTVSSRFFVVTGGPGAGKTTLLEALAARGYACAPEAGRAVIREQVASGGTALPFADRQGFAERMLEHDIASYQRVQAQAGVTFFDRGIPDVIGFCGSAGSPSGNA
jgi:predicted ATPase